VRTKWIPFGHGYCLLTPFHLIYFRCPGKPEWLLGERWPVSLRAERLKSTLTFFDLHDELVKRPVSAEMSGII